MKALQAPIREEADLSKLASSFFDVQHTRIILTNRFKSTGEDKFAPYIEGLEAVEKQLAVHLGNEADQYPICEWITSQRGLGKVLAGQLIGVIKDVGRFNNISKLWTYCGYGLQQICQQCGKLYFPPEEKDARRDRIAKRLQQQSDKKIVKDDDDTPAKQITKANKMLCQCKHPEPKWEPQRRREGILGNWNPTAKMVVHKVGEQFVKQGSYYREIYDKAYAKALVNLEDEVAKKVGKKTKNGVTKGTAHVHARAMRDMQKQFLADLWVKWRELEGLPVTKPYVIDQLHHTNYEPPPEVMSK